MSRGRRRIWCETAPYAEIAKDSMLSAIREREMEIIVAAWPAQTAELVALAERARDAGVPFAVWPMLEDHAGRWLSAENAAPFMRFVRSLVDELERRDARPVEIAFDLEPPIDRVRRWLGGQPGAAAFGDRDFARRALAELTRELAGRGMRVSAAIVPFVLFDRGRLARPGGFERAMGTPVSGIAWDHASFMVYTSLMEGYSRGLLRRRDLTPLLALACRRAASAFGSAAGISLGAVGTGALGDEAIYRSTDELREDVAIARAAGVDDLSLFDLGGALKRPPFEAWLDAFVTPEPARTLPGLTPAAMALIGAGIAIERLLWFMA